MPSPPNALARAVRRAGHSDLLYSASATPDRSIAPSATCPSPSRFVSGTELARAISPSALAAAPATEPLDPSGQPGEARHQAANDPNAPWNPWA